MFDKVFLRKPHVKILQKRSIIQPSTICVSTQSFGKLYKCSTTQRNSRASSLSHQDLCYLFISLLQVHNAPSNQRVSSPVGLVRSTQSANKSPDYGWADWTTEKVSCFSIDASHFDLLNGDNVSLVAQYLKSILLVKVQFK